MKKGEIPITVLLVVSAAVVLAASVGQRSRISDRSPTSEPNRLEFFDFWEEGLSVATRVGSESNSASAVSMVALMDYECPHSKRLHGMLRDLSSEHPGEVQVFYIHHPLDYHRYASLAARAAVSAEERGYFQPMIEALLARQDSLGIKSWAAYATYAGVEDPAFIQECVESDTVMPRIQSGIEFGSRVGVGMVPTLLVNGWRFYSPPSEEMLLQAFEAAKKGMPLDEVLTPEEPWIVPRYGGS